MTLSLQSTRHSNNLVQRIDTGNGPVDGVKPRIADSVGFHGC